MKMKLPLILVGTLFGAVVSQNVLAQDEIIRPYTSTRAEGMGGIQYTTGLYDENFFANPARVTANPDWKVTLFDVTAEVSSAVPTTVSALTGGGSSFYKGLGSNAGTNYHARFQTAFPAFYLPPKGDGKWGFAVGLIMSTQADINLRQSFNIDPLVVTDIGPAFTAGRKFFDDNSLSVGATAHLDYRLSSNTAFSFTDLIQGKSLSPTKTGGQGTGLDFDLGTTYAFQHYHPWNLNFSVAGAINNILDGKYSNIGFKPIESNGVPTPAALPLQQPRSLNFGASAMRPTLGVLHDTLAAIEFTDFGNNTNGGIFRTIHLGGETHFSILAGRVGINQGYLCAGASVYLKILEVDVATYGEELSLNAGGLEDRIYALHVKIQI
jgi:hypothetical protein